MPEKQQRYEAYADEVMSTSIHNFRLRQIVRDLEKDERQEPNNMDLISVLGIALFRIGQTGDALNKLRIAAFRGQTHPFVSNYIRALQQNNDYLKAYQEQLRFQHVLAIKDLSGAVLAGEYSGKAIPTGESLPSNVKAELAMIEKSGLATSLSNIFTTLFEQGSYGWSYMITPDFEDEELVIDIEIMIPASLDDVAKKSFAFSNMLASKYNTHELMHIIPQYRVME